MNVDQGAIRTRSKAFSIYRCGVLSALLAAVWGASVAGTKPPSLIDGHVTLERLARFTDCVPMAHSRALNRLVFACTPGSIVIISTDTGKVEAIKAQMSGEQPFIDRSGQSLFLYYPGGADRLAIREVDVLAKRFFDRSILVEPGFTYSSIYLNPRDRCVAVGLVAKGSGEAVIKVYEYEPRDHTPLRVGGKARIEVEQGQNVRVFGGPNNNSLACVRDRSGELVLFSSRFESDLQPGKPGGVLFRITPQEERVIQRGSGLLEFFQPKLAPQIFARDGVSRGLMQINTDTGDIRVIGADVEGLWEDYDPLTQTGVVTTPHAFDARTGLGPIHRICLATLLGCVAGQPTLTTYGDLFSPSVSNGWLGDGFITMSSGNLHIERPGDGRKNVSRDSEAYWLSVAGTGSPQ